MRLSRPRSSAALPAAIAAAALLSSALPLVSAVPYARDDLHDAGYGYLVPRECNGGYCGSTNDLCCGVNQACTTVDATPTCIEYAELKARDELWARDVYTTTWTETKTYTRTVSSQEQVATTAIVYEQCVPASGSGQKACGNVCCGSWQYCAYEGQCLDSATAAAGGAASGAVSGAVSGGGGGYITTTISGVRTTMFSAPYRVTSGASITSTTTATTNGTAIAATGGGGGLSGGAIAGIVIGVIAGVILLLLLCFCCLVRGAWGAVSGIFGRKRKSEREKIVVEEESYVRHNVGAAASAHSRRERHGSWYDGRASAAAARKKEGGKGLLGMAAGLGTLALLLGLKRDKQAKPSKSHRSRSSYSSSYYTDSYTRSGTSSGSSGGRTRRSRGSGGTRATRHTRTTSRRSSRR